MSSEERGGKNVQGRGKMGCLRLTPQIRSPLEYTFQLVGVGQHLGPKEVAIHLAHWQTSRLLVCLESRPPCCGRGSEDTDHC